MWQAIAQAGSAIGGAVAGTALTASQNITPFTPTALQNISAFRARALADRLQTGTGMSDTAYSRYSEQIQGQSRQVRASGAETVRGAMIQSAVADRIIKDMFRKAQAIESSGLQDLTVKDIEAAERKLKLSLGAEQIAGARADVLANIEKENILRKEQLEMQKKVQILNLFLGTSKQIGTAATQIGEDIADRKTDDATEAEMWDEFDEVEEWGNDEEDWT